MAGCRTDEIDAVAPAGRSRVPVLAGEAKWTKRVGTAALQRRLERKAAALTRDPEDLLFAVAGRREVADIPSGVLAYTAEEIFSPAEG